MFLLISTFHWPLCSLTGEAPKDTYAVAQPQNFWAERRASMADALNMETSNIFVISAAFPNVLVRGSPKQHHSVDIIGVWQGHTKNRNNIHMSIFYHVFRGLGITCTICPYFFGPENLHIVRLFHFMCTQKSLSLSSEMN